jgi:hypothetical protein
VSRQSDRNGLEPPVRVRMLEDDMDRAEERIEHNRNTLRTLIDGLRLEFSQTVTRVESLLLKEIDEAKHRAERAVVESEGQRKILVGVLVSVTSLAIGIVVQVLVFRGT